MPEQSNGVAGVQAEFPEHRDLVARLSLESEDFQALCEDHELARVALEALDASRPSQAERAAEYRALLQELRQAIAEALQFGCAAGKQAGLQGER